MHIRPLAKALLLSLTLLTTPSLLHAQDKKPEKEEEKAQPKFIGLWESPEEGFYVEFLADGVMLYLLIRLLCSFAPLNLLV